MDDGSAFSLCSFLTSVCLSLSLGYSGLWTHRVHQDCDRHWCWIPCCWICWCCCASLLHSRQQLACRLSALFMSPPRKPADKEIYVNPASISYSLLSLSLSRDLLPIYLRVLLASASNLGHLASEPFLLFLSQTRLKSLLVLIYKGCSTCLQRLYSRGLWSSDTLACWLGRMGGMTDRLGPRQS